MGDEKAEKTKAQLKCENSEANKSISVLIERFDAAAKKFDRMEESINRLEASGTEHRESIKRLEASGTEHMDDNFKKLEATLSSKFEEVGKRVTNIEVGLKAVKTKVEALETVKTKVEALEKKVSCKTLDSEETRKRNNEFLDAKIAPLFLRQSIDKCNHELVVFNIGEIDQSLSDLEIGIKFLSESLKLSKKDLSDHSPSHVQIRNRDTEGPLIVVISFKSPHSRNTVLKSRVNLKGTWITLRESIPFDYQAKNRDYIKLRNDLLDKHVGTLVLLVSCKKA